MNERRMGLPGVVASGWFLLALAACGGGAKQADSPGTCPEGTVLHGSDCLPPEAAGGDDSTSSHASSSASSGHSSAPEDKFDDHPSSGGGSGSAASATTSAATPSSGGGKTPYDKDAVEIELKRASRQVKANCGSATDDTGKANGPWGKTTANVTIGRNGHIKAVTLPAPYEGTPGGICAANAFEKIQFPPYAGSSDVAVDWEIELVKPKK